MSCNITPKNKKHCIFFLHFLILLFFFLRWLRTLMTWSWVRNCCVVSMPMVLKSHLPSSSVQSFPVSVVMMLLPKPNQVRYLVHSLVLVYLSFVLEYFWPPSFLWISRWHIASAILNVIWLIFLLSTFKKIGLVVCMFSSVQWTRIICKHNFCWILVLNLLGHFL